MDLRLNGKLTLVSGSTAGIGFAIAKALAGEGAHVIVNGRGEDRTHAACKEIQKALPQASVEPFAADLSTVQGAEEAYRRFPSVEILINNLGTFEPKKFEDITDQDWNQIIETNVMSGIRLSRFYLPKMIAAGWGRIIFISSESGVNIPVEMIHYGVTKSMQIALARGLAETTAGTAVTVNSVLPGPTRSEGVEVFIDNMAKARSISRQQVEDEFFQSVRPSSLLKRFATTDEVATLVAYVASPLSSATNGAALRVDGGVVRSML